MHIDQFCEDLHQKVAMTKSSLEALKTKIDTQAAEAEKDARSHLETVRERIEQNRKKLVHSQKEAETWVDHHKEEAKKKVAEWKAKGDAAKLKGPSGSCRPICGGDERARDRRHRRGRGGGARGLARPQGR